MTGVPEAFTLRLATASDVPRLRPLIELSARELQRDDYRASQLRGCELAREADAKVAAREARDGHHGGRRPLDGCEQGEVEHRRRVDDQRHHPLERVRALEVVR